MQTFQLDHSETKTVMQQVKTFFSPPQMYGAAISRTRYLKLCNNTIWLWNTFGNMVYLDTSSPSDWAQVFEPHRRHQAHKVKRIAMHLSPWRNVASRTGQTEETLILQHAKMFKIIVCVQLHASKVWGGLFYSWDSDTLFLYATQGNSN